MLLLLLLLTVLLSWCLRAAESLFITPTSRKFAFAQPLAMTAIDCGLASSTSST
jgi:hypothetical protein